MFHKFACTLKNETGTRRGRAIHEGVFSDVLAILFQQCFPKGREVATMKMQYCTSKTPKGSPWDPLATPQGPLRELPGPLGAPSVFLGTP